MGGSMEGQILQPEEILRELSCIGMAKVTDFLAVDDNALVIRSTAELDAEQSAAIAAVERTSTGIKVKFYDKLKALELLGKQYGLFEGKNDGQKPKNNLLQAILESTKEDLDISDLSELQ
jgi:phage terminase small subunit